MRRLFAFLLFLVPLAAPRAQDADAIEALVTATHDAGLFDGSVLVSDGGRVLYSGGVGLANVEWGIPNAPDTRFLIGSVTKQFTAALVLQLVEEGLVDLQTPITTYVPAYPAEPGDRVTVHHLLTHTSGLPNFTALAGFGDIERDPFSPDSFLQFFQDAPLDFEPGASWSYSNSGYFLLGVLIEKVTGQTYAHALHERLLEPLGMNDSAYGDGAEVFERAATDYVRVAAKLQHAHLFDTSIPYAAGMILSTVEDMKLWGDALGTGRMFESPETLALLLAPHAAIPGSDGDVQYGYGIGVGTIRVGARSVRVAQHNGRVGGFATGFRRLPDRDAVIVATSNTGDGSGSLIDGITALLYGETAEQPRPSATRPVRAALAAGGVEAAEAAFRAARAGDDYTVSEDDLNGIGYEALSRGEVETAVALFQLNAEAYPESWNVHDSLGEGLAAAGRRVEAIRAYERSLELNPDNENGRAILAQLRAE